MFYTQFWALVAILKLISKSTTPNVYFISLYRTRNGTFVLPYMEDAHVCVYVLLCVYCDKEYVHVTTV